MYFRQRSVWVKPQRWENGDTFEEQVGQQSWNIVQCKREQVLRWKVGREIRTQRVSNPTINVWAPECINEGPMWILTELENITIRFLLWNITLMAMHRTDCTVRKGVNYREMCMEGKITRSALVREGRKWRMTSQKQKKVWQLTNMPSEEGKQWVKVLSMKNDSNESIIRETEENASF